MHHAYLKEITRLTTSGARAIEHFVLDDQAYIAVPQLAEDMPDTAPNMNGGNSDTEVLLFRSTSAGYQVHQRLPSPGGEDAEFFSIDQRHFLAIASIRSGHGPYQFTTDSILYEWQNGRFVEFQHFPTVAAKQWHHFILGDHHFLALAQGIVAEGIPHAASPIYKWDGTRFSPFQEIPSQWAYNWLYFELAGRAFLAHADHIQDSVLYRWNGSRFEPFQSLVASQGRAFAFFEAGGIPYLACARLQSDSVVLRWDGERFVEDQVLVGPGAREFTILKGTRDIYLLRVNFILGTPSNPTTALSSQLYCWQKGTFTVVDEIPTFGGTDACAWQEPSGLYIAISNSLSAAVQFRTDTIIYQFVD
jgi:hypothetical protein